MKIELTPEEFDALLQAARLKPGLSGLEAQALSALLTKAQQQIQQQQAAKEQTDGDN